MNGRKCFNDREGWNNRRVDSRTSRFTNKALIQEWLHDYGEDSDWFRVRVSWPSARADELQYIDKGRIEAAQKRAVGTAKDELLAQVHEEVFITIERLVQRW